MDELLESLRAILKVNDNPVLKRIEGYTSSKGEQKHNEILSKNRAIFIHNILGGNSILQKKNKFTPGVDNIKNYESVIEYANKINQLNIKGISNCLIEGLGEYKINQSNIDEKLQRSVHVYFEY